MMNIKEYAEDVNKTPEEIMKLCEKIGIKFQDEETQLEEEDIILLDNEIQDSEDYVEDKEEQEENDDIYDDETFEKVMTLAEETNIDLDNTKNEEKFTKRNKKNKENKEDFKKQRKKIYKQKQKLQSNETKPVDNVIIYEHGMTVQSLAEKLGIAATEIIKKLMGLGVMTSLNQSLDYDTAEILVADYDKTLKREEATDISNFENLEIEDKEEDLVERPPVVTIMGHVDHGKTTLLDYIRKTNIVGKEAGGITQAIGAYKVKWNDKEITFIDTPGHEAFTEMRARGASVTDIVIIIVAADDGVMPQTKEAIDHAKAANVPIIVAINKIDKENANVDRVMSELVENGLTPEEWGGDVMVNKISARSGEGVDKLLENILLIAELNEYKANPNRYATGVVIESSKDKHVGSKVTILIQNGTLRLSDPIVVGTGFGKVRTLTNDLGRDIVEASPSTPVEITGISSLPSAGDKFMAFETEKQAKQIALERQARAKEKDSNRSGMSLDDLFSQIQEGIKQINIVLKADVNGSLEAVKNSLEKIEVEGVRITVVRAGVGAITQSDLVLAEASNAIIIGFNVRANATLMEEAKNRNIEIRTYDIIYKVVEEMESAMKGMLDPEYEEVVIGTAEIRQMFKFSKVGLIAGCHVLTGKVTNNAKARIIRDDVVVYNGKVKTLQHEKDQVKEVKKGMDCGITLDACQDYKEKDIIELYELVEVKR